MIWTVIQINASISFNIIEERGGHGSVKFPEPMYTLGHSIICPHQTAINGTPEPPSSPVPAGQTLA